MFAFERIASPGLVRVRDSLYNSSTPAQEVFFHPYRSTPPLPKHDPNTMGVPSTALASYVGIDTRMVMALNKRDASLEHVHPTLLLHHDLFILSPSLSPRKKATHSLPE